MGDHAPGPSLRLVHLLIALWVLAAVFILVSVPRILRETWTHSSIPGFTHAPWISRKERVVTGPRLAPDSSRFVFVVQIDRWRPGYEPFPILFGERDAQHFPTRIELHAYDLARRRGPVRVAAWEVDPRWDAALESFDGRVAVVGTNDGEEIRHDSVDVATGYRRPARQGYLPGGRLSFTPDRLSWTSGALSVVEEHRLFVLRGPAPRVDEVLFDLPFSAGDDSLFGVDDLEWQREIRAHETALQQIVSVTCHKDGDSVRVEVGTYAPRPDSRSRRYRYWFSLSVPDTVEDEYGSFGSRSHELLAGDVVLGGTEGRFSRAFAYADLNRILAPHRRRRGMVASGWGKAPWQTVIGANLIYLSEPGERYSDARSTGASDGITIPPP